MSSANLEIHSIPEIDGSYSEVIIIRNFFDDDEKKQLLYNLDSIDDWREGQAFGKPIKRVLKWYHLDGISFCPTWKVQHDRWKSNDYEDWLKQFQKDFENNLGTFLNDNGVYDKCSMLHKFNFNSVLINKYRDGTDFIRPHKDDTRIFGENPTIVSASFGAQRKFIMKRVHFDSFNPKSMKMNDKERDLNLEIPIENGTIIIMAGACQKYFSHEVPIDASCDKIRYNLTFRHHYPMDK